MKRPHHHPISPPVSPIQSYGIILFSNNRVLLIQRKDSFGYITCIDNKDIGHKDIADTLATLTIEEKKKIITYTWDQLWFDVKGPTKNDGKDECKARFEWLGIRDTVRSLDQRGEKWTVENEWGLPKGRMSLADNHIGQRSALRELKEETGITKCNLVPTTNPLIDTFIGTDGKTYTCAYYVATACSDIIPRIPTNAANEIRNIQWVPVAECNLRLRPSTSAIIETAFAKIS